ncbi:MAG: NAD(P)/FAD-dependent oxidoreductase [Nitrososphaerota archaeon]|nr:NAD(P)/FAD-dependent oxidoreductase [Nitrososphaerota archaeon]
MQQEYDIIVIGSGVNGLTVAAYMSKAGQKVLVLEKRLVEGGGLSTEQIFPGYYSNLHSIFHYFASDALPYKDLELEKYGADYIVPEANHVVILKDQSSLICYNDQEKTYQNMSKFSKKDADTWRRMQKFRDLMYAQIYGPPFEYDEWGERFHKKWGDLGKEYGDLIKDSAFHVCKELFENEIIQQTNLFNSAANRIRDTVPGSAYGAIRSFCSMGNIGLVRGGSNMLAKALVAFIHTHGGLVLTQSAVSKIFVKDGEAKGVRTRDGREFYASKAVVSNLDPETTFFKLVGRDYIPRDFAAKIESWKPGQTLFGVHLVIREPPRFRAGNINPDVNKGYHITLGYDVPSDMHEHWDEIARGEPPAKPAGDCFTLSLFDRSQAPAGYHTSGFWQFAPYKLSDGKPDGWDQIKYDYMEHCLARWREFAPNMNDYNIVHKFAYTPLDTARSMPNMIEGDAHMGGYGDGQTGTGRMSNKTPIRKLYLSGSCCHPGGAITFGAGYNALNVIAEDLGIKRWWPKPSFLQGFAWENWK